jgi:ABC-2 type transport system ATP-binding protein
MDMMKFYRNLYPNFDEKLFKKIMDCFPAINPKKMVRSLSKGMQKQVAFMLSIAARPELMILDEPVDGLDPVMRRQIWSLIMSDVAEHGLTVLVSSHNLRELEDVCDHVGIMNNGKILIERSLDELQTSITKIQIAFEGEMPKLPENVEVLKKISAGRVHTIIVKGKPREAEQAIAATNPLLMDVLPLTLEEIFIYELGGENYAVKDIIF